MLDKITYEIKYQKQISINNLYEDVKAIKKFLNMYSTIKQIAISEGNINIIDICIDIKYAIEECNFTPMQKHRLNLWMMGYKECEIADELKVSRVLIHNFIINACIKISEKLKR